MTTLAETVTPEGHALAPEGPSPVPSAVQREIARPHVLLVDDDEDYVEALGSIFTNLGFEVSVAFDGLWSSPQKPYTSGGVI